MVVSALPGTFYRRSLSVMSVVTAMDSWDKPNIHSETARLAEYPLYGPYIRCTLHASGSSDDLSVVARGMPYSLKGLSKPAATALAVAERPTAKGPPYL